MKEKLLKTINHYGVTNQQRKLNEEIYELQEAITTHELKKSVEYEIPLTEIIGTKEHIAEEIADVLNVVEQFIFYYEIDVQDVIEIKHRKMDRQMERIKDENKMS